MRQPFDIVPPVGIILTAVIAKSDFYVRIAYISSSLDNYVIDNIIDSCFMLSACYAKNAVLSQINSDRNVLKNLKVFVEHCGLVLERVICYRKFFLWYFYINLKVNITCSESAK